MSARVTLESLTYVFVRFGVYVNACACVRWSVLNNHRNRRRGVQIRDGSERCGEEQGRIASSELKYIFLLIRDVSLPTKLFRLFFVF